MQPIRVCKKGCAEGMQKGVGRGCAKFTTILSQKLGCAIRVCKKGCAEGVQKGVCRGCAKRVCSKKGRKSFNKESRSF